MKAVIWTILVGVILAVFVLVYGMVAPNPIGNGHGVDPWPIVIAFGGILVSGLSCIVAVPVAIRMLVANPSHRSTFNLIVTFSGAVLVLLVLGLLARFYLL